ncbi:MAG: ABC transporter ATP-binding protein [Chloroflexota bacterium]
MTVTIDTHTSEWRKRREQRILDLLPEEEDELDNVDPKLLFRLNIFLRPYRSQVILAVFFIVSAALVGVVAQPWIVGQVFDQGIEAGSVSDLRFWIGVFIASALFEWVANRYRISIMGIVGGHVVADVRAKLYNHLHTLSLNFHNNYSVGRMMSRLLGDITMLRDFITWSISGLFRSFFSLFGIIAIMLVINWRLALISFSVLPILAIATNYYRINIRLAYRSARTRSSLISGYFNESISGIRVTKSFTREEENFGFFDLLNSDLKRINFDAAFMTAIFFPAVEIVGSLSIGLVVVFGGMFILDQQLTAGELIAFVLYVQRFFEPIRELAQRFNVFQGAMASTERIFALLDTEPDLVDAPDAYQLPAIEGNVRFENVDFGYKADEPILKNVSLEARPGEQIALVGETGAGKSTVIRLLARFYDITDGQITIDGHDISAVTVESLRQQLGVVLQDTFLFSGTILENIRYGRLDATDDEVLAAAKAVGADDFVNRMPRGFQTEVGQDGVNLSVGQRQILSFARALLADPRILVLDEATSSVDTTTEKQIQAALETLLDGRTSFVIAHRLNTIVNSDKIIVLDQGEIVEEGTHDELLELEGRYYNLYTMSWNGEDGNR